MFVGRENELNEIKGALNQSGQHILLFGNRRVGKTTLALKALDSCGLIHISYECMKLSLYDNLLEMTKLLEEEKIIPPYYSFTSFIELFKYLNSLNKRIAIHIDEYPYLYVANNKDAVDSSFQNIIDLYSSNLNIIISGSHIGMMKELTRSNNPLFCRFYLVLNLKELNYLEASAFYPHLSNYDKVQFYAVFGGSPYVLEKLDETKSLKENIKETILKDLSQVLIFVSEGYTSDIQVKDKAASIFYKLGNSKLRYSKLEEKLHLEKNGLLNKQLKSLIEMGFIEKTYPINKTNDDKKATYQITNNLMRFYYTYIYGRINLISILGAEAFYQRYINDSIDTFISFRFEQICFSYLSLLIKEGKLEEVYNLGSYYYDDPINKRNGEFDLVIKHKDDYDVMEVKFLKGAVEDKIIDQEIEQIKQIKDLKINNYGFISINGFNHRNAKLKYQFNGDDIYFKK